MWTADHLLQFDEKFMHKILLSNLKLNCVRKRDKNESLSTQCTQQQYSITKMTVQAMRNAIYETTSSFCLYACISVEYRLSLWVLQQFESFNFKSKFVSIFRINIEGNVENGITNVTMSRKTTEWIDIRPNYSI